MSKKDFNDYVKVLGDQYKEFQKTLEQVSIEAQNNPTDLEFVSRLEEQVKPFRQNYERVLFLKYLLDQPADKSKLPAYQAKIEKKMRELSKSNTTEAVLEENKEIMEKIKVD